MKRHISRKVSFRMTNQNSWPSKHLNLSSIDDAKEVVEYIATNNASHGADYALRRVEGPASESHKSPIISTQAQHPARQLTMLNMSLKEMPLMVLIMHFEELKDLQQRATRAEEIQCKCST